MSIFEKYTEGIGQSIVNPHCDECCRSMSTPLHHQIGQPRICGYCEEIMAQEYTARFRDYMSQEKPRGRTVHKVKLPPGGLK